MVFSTDEFKEIIISVAVATMVFSFPDILSFLPIAFISVTAATFFSVFAFKKTAHWLHLKAFFSLWPAGSIIGLVAMLIQPIKLIPTSNIMVYHERFGKWKKKYLRYSHHMEATIKEVGMIAASSPAANLFLAVASWLALTVVFPENFYLAFFSMVNGWMALSSLIPVKSLPGGKIFLWKPWFWLLMATFSVIVVGFSASAVYLGW